MVVPSLGCYVLALLLTSTADSSAAFLAAGLLAGLGHGYCFPVLTAQVVNRTPAAYRGSALSMFTAVWGLSTLVFNPLAGAVADAWGDGVMFSLAAGGALGMMSAWTLAEHRLARQ
jgi:predicted MFS family arabinose efflux permease